MSRASSVLPHCPNIKNSSDLCSVFDNSQRSPTLFNNFNKDCKTLQLLGFIPLYLLI